MSVVSHSEIGSGLLHMRLGQTVYRSPLCPTVPGLGLGLHNETGTDCTTPIVPH